MKTNGKAHSVKPPIKVLHLTNVESSNYYLNNLCDYVDRRQVEMAVATLGKPGSFDHEIQQRGAQAFALDAPDRKHYPKALQALREIIRNERIDIVHTHLYDPTILGMLAGKTLGRKIVMTRHHSDEVYRIQNRLKQRAYLFGERLINRAASHIIAPSRMVFDILVKREGVPGKKVSLIPYPQTTARFDALSTKEIGRVKSELQMQEQLSFVCISRLYREKGHIYLFEAFARLLQEGASGVLYLLGKGPDEALIQAQASCLGIADRVRFLGWRNDALAIIAAADIVVHPSLHEALPSAVIEAIMLGKPLVASDVSGVRDIAGDSEYAQIVPPADADALYQAIARTIADLAGAVDRAQQGRRHLLQYMDATHIAQQYIACYEQVAAGVTG